MHSRRDVHACCSSRLWHVTRTQHLLSAFAGKRAWPHRARFASVRFSSIICATVILAWGVWLGVHSRRKTWSPVAGPGVKELSSNVLCLSCALCRAARVSAHVAKATFRSATCECAHLYAHKTVQTKVRVAFRCDDFTQVIRPTRRPVGRRCVVLLALGRPPSRHIGWPPGLG